MKTESASDAQLIEYSIELATESAGDIGPAVYERFFERFPNGRHLFRVVDPAQPPHGCGQMLFEVLSLLQDNAQQKTYVSSYSAHIATEHAGFGVQEQSAYFEFLESIRDVVAGALGKDWLAVHQVAWSRQIAALSEKLTVNKGT